MMTLQPFLWADLPAANPPCSCFSLQPLPLIRGGLFVFVVTVLVSGSKMFILFVSLFQPFRKEILVCQFEELLDFTFRKKKKKT